MPEWLSNVDWKFLFGDVIIPIGLFVAGFFCVFRKKRYVARFRVPHTFSERI